MGEAEWQGIVSFFLFLLCSLSFLLFLLPSSLSSTLAALARLHLLSTPHCALSTLRCTLFVPSGSSCAVPLALCLPRPPALCTIRRGSQRPAALSSRSMGPSCAPCHHLPPARAFSRPRSPYVVPARCMPPPPAPSRPQSPYVAPVRRMPPLLAISRPPPFWRPICAVSRPSAAPLNPTPPFQATLRALLGPFPAPWAVSRPTPPSAHRCRAPVRVPSLVRCFTLRAPILCRHACVLRALALSSRAPLCRPHPPRPRDALWHPAGRRYAPQRTLSHGPWPLAALACLRAATSRPDGASPHHRTSPSPRAAATSGHAVLSRPNSAVSWPRSPHHVPAHRLSSLSATSLRLLASPCRLRATSAVFAPRRTPVALARPRTIPTSPLRVRVPPLPHATGPRLVLLTLPRASATISHTQACTTLLRAGAPRSPPPRPDLIQSSVRAAATARDAPDALFSPPHWPRTAISRSCAAVLRT
ncbi:hypothetical protein DENSPDRAFT_626240 [Dentipellis sp. KUC8613]|nr:hypothetical protein DENSPDRAFT_626240 [Dentipellis sp. KUC8613]